MAGVGGEAEYESLIQVAAAPPRLCPLPPLGGFMKTGIGDFEVEEVPAYEPCGEGEHLFLWIEKRGLGSAELLRRIAAKLGIDERQIGIAGLKDRHAVTRQYVSVPREVEGRIGELDDDELRVLKKTPHRNKLRTGHLRANRFKVVISEVEERAGVSIEKLVQWVEKHGIPNYYGPQRFGRELATARGGISSLRAGRRALYRSAGPSRFRRKLFLSAAQALLFNHYLTDRISDGLFGKVITGDVLKKLGGGLFVPSDPAVEQERYAARAVVPTGPIYGRRMMAAEAEAKRREDAVLERFGIKPAAFDQFRSLLAGSRRPIVTWVSDLHWRVAAGRMELRFVLPAGSYATVLLRELGVRERE